MWDVLTVNFYYLNKLYPTAQKVGIDLTEKFINVAQV